MHDLLGTLEPFAINQEQDYSTERGLCHSHPREDEIILPAAGHHSFTQYHGSLAQDSFGKNVDEFLQRATAPAWNPAIAAQQSPTAGINTLQRIQLGVPHLSTPRQPVHLLSDEGYYTYRRSQQDTRSERSNRSNSFSQMNNQPRAIPRTIPGQQLVRAPSQGPSDYSMDSQQTPTRGRAKSDAGSNPGAIQCPVERCTVMSKTLSDQKKHLARHKLEHVCKQVGCSRNMQGFATVNDLNRHMVTVHKLRSEGTRLYRCLAPGCSKPEKDWPRKDNFKSHLMKAHPNEDVETLIRQWEGVWDRRRHGSTGSGDQEMFMNPRASVSETPQQVPRREVTFDTSHTFPSSHAQHHPVSQPRSQPYIYVPHGAEWASRPMDGTSQLDNYQNALRRQQSTPIPGYQDVNNGPTTARSSAHSSGGFAHSSIVAFPEQQPSHHYRASIAGPTMSYARTEMHDDQDQFQDWTMPFALMPAASHMSRTASFNRPVLQVPVQNQNTVGQRAQTVADFPSLEEDRRDDMMGFPAYQQHQEPPDTGYQEGGDILSGFGSGLADQMFIATFVDDTSESRVQQPEQMEVDQSSDNAGDVNVGSLKEFLEPFTAKADDDPAKRRMKSILTNALLSLGSTTGDASSAASNTVASTDQFIEEYSDAGKKTMFRCKWSKCNSSKKEWKLRSEIKKHMKRHSKPYGCTFDKCYRQFGSKSDWVRHETKRHSQQESWRCVLNNPRIAPGVQPCRKLFWSKQHFAAHLGDVHKLTKDNEPEEFTLQLTKQHINANFQPQYWCGFHKSIIRLAKKGKEGIHERYNHIDHHLTSEGLFMDDWVPAHGIISRGKLRDKSPPRQGQLPDENEDDGDVSPHVPTSEESNSSNDASESPPPAILPSERPPSQLRQQQSIRQVSQQPQSRPPHNAPLAIQPHAGQKRTASAAGLESSAPRRVRRQATFWRCHACQYKNLLATSPACVCSHEKCQMCTHVYHRVGDER